MSPYKIEPQVDISSAVRLSGLRHFTGTFQALGGGEVNNTYRLDCANYKAVLRVAKDNDQDTLKNEAHALGLLNIPSIAKLLFYDDKLRLNDRRWIVESYVAGEPVDRLSIAQFKSLGALLGQVHISTVQSQLGVNIWRLFLKACYSFGDEQFLLHHPDRQLRQLITEIYAYFQTQQPQFDHVPLSLIHGDATPSNTLVRGNEVSLIDWEFSKFNDPMAEFSTIYYDDMEYNRGKWRPQIRDNERAALFEGYESAGGNIDEARLKLWMIHDKLGAAVFLYWRLHNSTRDTSDQDIQQYQLDLCNLVRSLEHTFMSSNH